MHLYHIHHGAFWFQYWGLNQISFYRRLTFWLSTRVNTFHLGGGLLSQFPQFCYFPKLSALSKHTLAIEYHVYIWQVSPHLSCGDTCQIWIWLKESNRYFCKIKNFCIQRKWRTELMYPHPTSVSTIDTKKNETVRILYRSWYDCSQVHICGRGILASLARQHFSGGVRSQWRGQQFVQPDHRD